MELFLLCVKVFFVRILDVSLGTIRSIVTIKGKIKVASFIGFIELFVWFVVVKEALNTDNNSIFIAISYAGGFATGTYLGGFISNHFIKIKLGVQAILSKKDDELVKSIRESGYAVSVIDVKGQNRNDSKYMLFIEIDSDRYNHLTKLIKHLDNQAFIVVNETKYVHNGYFAK
jgi:uncharacterized protein YebE (UPF0316 family)